MLNDVFVCHSDFSSRKFVCRLHENLSFKPAGLSSQCSAACSPDLCFGVDLCVHDGVAMPCNMQSWSFGFRFNLSFHDVMLPSSPLTLTYGYRFGLSLRGVTLTLLWTLAFVDCSGLKAAPRCATCLHVTATLRARSLYVVSMRRCLLNLLVNRHSAVRPAAVDLWRTSRPELARCVLQSSLPPVTLGGCFNQRFQGVALPSSLQLLTSANASTGACKVMC